MYALNQKLGDHVVHTLPLTRDGEAFVAGEGEVWSLVFSLKLKRSDPDEDAVVQKASGAGITVSVSDALVTLLRVDTVAMAPRTLFAGIRATEAGGDSFTAWEGTLRLDRPVSQEVETSIPVFVAEPPYPNGVFTQLVLPVVVFEGPPAPIDPVGPFDDFNVETVIIPYGSDGAYTITAPTEIPVPELDLNPSVFVGPFWVHNRDSHTATVFGVAVPQDQSAFIRYKAQSSSWDVTVE